MIPTVGRMVHYFYCRQKDNKTVIAPAAATVTDVVDDTTVHLCVTYPNSMVFVENVQQGQSIGQWDWPQRV
ncbi:hypothetical protein [Paenibacillus sp. 23TSA30-6]|uniref:hypothetical protein n=1 Tax=Paenibacillus sp. 23TSA30-6 TaxID=2546104 RepID=UPI0017883ABA|nr:hypothetical protein [Paenibacillus sp. 23TSA30-6]MBE0335108.1 hypothetical protein [Paenibacillus sp. 23TSA30-6]